MLWRKMKKWSENIKRGGNFNAFNGSKKCIFLFSQLGFTDLLGSFIFRINILLSDLHDLGVNGIMVFFFVVKGGLCDDQTAQCEKND